MTIQDAIEKLGSLSSIFDYKPLLDLAKNDGILDTICTMGASLVFMTTMISIIIQVLKAEGKFEPKHVFHKFLFGCFLGILVGSPTIYLTIAEPIMSLGKTLSDNFLEQQVFKFQSYFRMAVDQVTQQNQESTSFFNPSLWNANIQLLLMSGAFYVMIISFFILVSYSPILAVLGVFVGPVVIPWVMIPKFKGIVSEWLKYMFAVCLFPLFVAIALATINDMKILVSFVEFSQAYLLPTLIITVLMVFFVIVIPMVIGEIFDVPALNMMSLIFGILTLFLGLLPVGAKMILWYRTIKQKKRVIKMSKR